MAPIQERNAIVKKIISIALGDEDLEDEEMLEWAQMGATAAMSIISAVGDDDVFEGAIAKLSADDQVVQREIRAQWIGSPISTTRQPRTRRRWRASTPKILLVAKELEHRDKQSGQ